MARQLLGSEGAGSTQLSQNIAPGILTQVMFSCDDASIGPADLHVSMIIREPLTPRTQPIYVLTDGYVSIDSPLVWMGFLALDSNSEIFARIIGQLNGQFFLNHRRLTFQAGNAITKLLKAVIRD